MEAYQAARRAEVGRCSLGQDRPYNFGLDSVDQWAKVRIHKPLLFILYSLKLILNIK
jgi:hypothetical protein